MYVGGDFMDYGIVLGDKEFYTVGEVAKVLSYSRQWVYRLIEEGSIGAVRLSGGRRISYRIPREEVMRILDSWRV